jgi:hypothetical protein
MDIPKLIKDNPALAAAGAAGLYGLLNKDSKVGEFLGMSSNQRPVGYSEGIPEYTATRQLAPNAFATTAPTTMEGPGTMAPRRPGSGGRRYFTDTAYTPTGKTMGPKPSGGIFDSLTPEQAQEMINGMFGTGGVSNTPTPTPTPTPTTPKFTNAAVKGTLDTLIGQYGDDREGLYRAVAQQIKNSGVGIEGAAKQISEIFTLNGKPVTADEIAAKYKQLGFAQGGLASLPQSQGYYLGGSTDGMADQVPASINGQQEAALSDGEFVMPADVVSGLGNGNSDAGAKVLYSMMDRVRQARTGTKEQGRKITPNKFTPV